MDKIPITEKMHLEKEWFADAKKQTIETLPNFMNHVLNDYCHDYGTICHAITACSIAAAWAVDNSEHGGITGFQASCVMWEFVRQWSYPNNKCGLKIIDFDNMLYPQYEVEFIEQEIPKEVWKSLQEQAKELLETKTVASDWVIRHWQGITKGIVPFGYTVKND